MLKSEENLKYPKDHSRAVEKVVSLLEDKLPEEYCRQYDLEKMADKIIQRWYDEISLNYVKALEEDDSQFLSKGFYEECEKYVDRFVESFGVEHSDYKIDDFKSGEVKILKE